jgi:hypothetical protein
MEENNETTLATFKVLVTDWEKFKTISKSKGKTASFFLTQFVAQTIADEENLPPKVSPDKFITQENLVAAIAPLVARIEALEKDDWGTAEQNAYERMQESRADNIPGEKVLEWLTVLEKDEPDIYTSEDGEPINDDSKPSPGQNNPDPTPPVDESPKSCFDLVGTVSKVAEVPAEKEQNLESPGADPTPSEVPDTIPVPTEFSGKSLDEVLDSRGDAPPTPWVDNEGFDIVNEEHARYWDGQWVAWYTASACLDLSDPSDFQEVLDSGKLDGIVERIVLTDGDEIFRKIGETKTPVEETDD